MAQKNPADVAARWVRRTQAATQDYTDAVNRVTESPMQKAAAQKQAMIQKLTAAVNDGTWERGLARVSLADWKAKTSQVGAQRIAQGVTQAEGKMQTFMSQFLPYADSVSQQVKGMPKITLEDSIARASAAIRAMAAFKQQRH